jgi:hypothetical protein
MSYSFSVTADNKVDAKEKIAAQFDVVLQGQAVHETDRSAAQAAAFAYVDMLADPDDEHVISVNIHGYLSWTEAGKFTNSNVGISAGVVPKVE